MVNFSKKFEDYSDLKNISFVFAEEVKTLLQAEFVAIVEYTYEKIEILSTFPIKNISNDITFSQELFLILKNLEQNNFKYLENENIYSEHFREYLPLFDYDNFKIIPICSDANKIITLEIYGKTKNNFNKKTKLLDELILVFQKLYLYQVKFQKSLSLSIKNETIVRFLDRIRNSLDENELEKIILEEVARIFKADRVYFLHVNHNLAYTPFLGKEFLANPYVRSLKGNGLNFQSVWEQLKDGSMTPPVFVIESTEKFIKQNNFEKTPIDEYIQKSQIQSSYPFLFFENNDENIYIIIQYSQKTQILSNDDFDLMNLIIKQSYTAINQAKMHSKLIESNKKEKLLKEIYSEIVDFQSEKQIYSYFAEKIMYILNAIGVVFAKFPFNYVQNIEYFEYFKITNLNLSKFKNNNDIINMLLSKQLLYNCKIPSTKKDLNSNNETEINCFAIIPVNEKISILIFFDDEKEFSALDKNIMFSIAELISRMLNDVSKNKEIANLKEKFLSTLSHDLYVPLIAQRNAINYLAEKNKDESLIDILYELRKTNAQTEDMLSALTSIYKYESNKFVLNKTNCDLNNLINLLLKNYQNKIEEKNIKILNNIFSENLNFWGDAKEILKVFKIIFNLLLEKSEKNAEISINAYLDTEKLKICIFSNALKTNRFEDIVFDELDDSLEGNIGEGIYWHLAKLIILANNGEISIDNSCFCIDLEKVI